MRRTFGKQSVLSDTEYVDQIDYYQIIKFHHAMVSLSMSYTLLVVDIRKLPDPQECIVWKKVFSMGLATQLVGQPADAFEAQYEEGRKWAREKILNEEVEKILLDKRYD